MVIRTRARKENAKAKAKEEALREKRDKQKETVTPALPNDNRVPLIWRAFNSDCKLEPEEILEAIYWLRQTQGIIVGIIYGVAKITGSIGITSFLALALTGPSALMKRIHSFDEEEVLKMGSPSTEGLLPAFALFLLSWIISYTTFL